MLTDDVRRFRELCEASGVDLSTGIAVSTLLGLQSPDVRDAGALFYGSDLMEKLNEGRFVPTIGELQ